MFTFQWTLKTTLSSINPLTWTGQIWISKTDLTLYSGFLRYSTLSHTKKWQRTNPGPMEYKIKSVIEIQIRQSRWPSHNCLVCVLFYAISSVSPAAHLKRDRGREEDAISFRLFFLRLMTLFSHINLKKNWRKLSLFVRQAAEADWCTGCPPRRKTCCANAPNTNWPIRRPTTTWPRTYSDNWATVPICPWPSE